MSNKVGDRLLISILVLTAFFAVSVTASGQCPPTAKHTHCNPFDLDCDPDATATPTATPTPRPPAAQPELRIQSWHGRVGVFGADGNAYAHEHAY